MSPDNIELQNESSQVLVMRHMKPRKVKKKKIVLISGSREEPKFHVHYFSYCTLKPQLMRNYGQYLQDFAIKMNLKDYFFTTRQIYR